MKTGAANGTAKSETAQVIQGIQEQLLQLEDAITPILPTEWLATDLTMPQLKVLLILGRTGATRMSELATGLEVTMATATGVVDRLVEKGYVVREGLPGDRRVVISRLSPEGEEFMKSLRVSGRIQIGRILEAMTPEQLSIVAKGTVAFIEAARKAAQLPAK
jgi:DNA-binding MarR family transcriptional regulator